jgi:hypothetical protein
MSEQHELINKPVENEKMSQVTTLPMGVESKQYFLKKV